MKPYKSLLFCLRYAAFWLAFFIVARILFLVFNLNATHALTMQSVWQIFRHGMIHDISVTAYILLIPFVWLAVTSFFHGKWIVQFLIVYTWIILLVVTVIVIIDVELYKYWGFRLDATPLLYIKQPKEMLASVTAGIIVRQILLGILLYGSFLILFGKWIKPGNESYGKGGLAGLILYLLLAPSLIIPARGGFGVATLNAGSVYFSKNPFENHAAVNVVFNLGYALSNLESEKNPYTFIDGKTAAYIADSLLVKSDRDTIRILNTDRPDILIIVLESFTAKAIGCLGGVPGITPNFDRYAREGLLFTNTYSSGDRSDKGLVAVLSAYPALPSLSIIKYPKKTQNLSFLSKDLKKLGYHSAFFHGGDVDFANMRSYFTNGGFDKIVSKSDFNPRDFNSKWGVHDHVVFDSLASFLAHPAEPFFTVFFTLSSHEPFDVPGKPINPSAGSDEKFLHAVHYTDSCLGVFLDRVRQMEWWNNALVILVADHGSRHPGFHDANDYRRYHIGMLWLGGALRLKGTIPVLVSQTSIVPTIVRQMDLSDASYRFGQSIFDPARKQVAMFFYNDGFGMITDHSNFAFDNRSHSVTRTVTGYKDADIIAGRAFLQYLYDDFMAR
ncbi:MAG TPA: sulfatase-like hydrolase/transferase [Bacteroidales bacterium]|nr:sulfatase-like hydrolase/transferase [Bacteroidales bacterium]HQK36617.1 sulfatase-like hydrolase/transferase [Bacteroidales bacterium]